MVGNATGTLCALAVAALTLPATAWAETPANAMFPTKGSCYAREYARSHLARHPAQRVTSIALSPEPRGASDAILQIWVIVTVRDWPGTKLEALAYCEDAGNGALFCGMEGDAGSFTLKSAKAGAILLSVGRFGMGFEGDQDFITLAPDTGDDRSFLLPPTNACR